MEKPRILINGLHAKTGGGVTYLRHLLPALAARGEFDLHVVIHQDQANLFSGGEKFATWHKAAFRNGFLGRLIWEQTTLPDIGLRLKVGAIFSPANFGPLWGPPGVILLRNALTVGDEETRLSKRLYWWALGWATRMSLARAPVAMAVSEYALKVIAAGCPEKDRAKIQIVHHGVSNFFTPDPDVPRENFILFVGDIYIQKNLLCLIEAFTTVAESMPDVRLVVAGRPVDQGYTNEVEAAAMKAGLLNKIDFLGHQTPAQLRDLYRRCKLFVFPSLVETFGNPLLEAMACGAPVLSSDQAAMPEIAGGAARYFDPRDPVDLADDLISLLGDDQSRTSLSEASLKRAAEFTWEKTAEQVASLFNAAARVR